MALAKEISRTFDTLRAVVVVNICDEFGNVSPHSIYLNGTSDVNATVTQLIADTDTATEALRPKMIAAGWTPPA
jgi:hypothetical protein